MDSDMRAIPAACAALSLMLALSACDAGSAPSRQQAAEEPAGLGTASAAPRAEPSPGPTDPLAGLDCEPAQVSWARKCTAPDYDVSGMPGVCTSDSASFGAVNAGAPVEAHDRLGAGARSIATLAGGQFVCVQYIADPLDGESERWLYVTAIPPDSVPACRTALCGDPAARSRWHDARGAACAVDGDVYSPGCPAGWVPGSHIDEYSMGLGGTHAGS
jgi:hypothetical protein